MKFFIASATLTASAYALAARQAPCGFQLTASGGPGGAVGELDNGQIRIGQGLPAATFSITDMGLVDGSGNGCMFAADTTQLQCEPGAAATSGFELDCNGDLTLLGNNKFAACPTGEDGAYNLYANAPVGQGMCVGVSLNAGDQCHESCAPPEPTDCPADLAGSYEFPRLIVPVSQSVPDKALGNSPNGTITSDLSSIYNFDIPAEYAGSQCSLIFLLPQPDQSPDPYELSGDGKIDFAALDGTANEKTTLNTAPKVGTDFGAVTVETGNSYVVSSFKCDLFAGKTFSYELASVSGASLNYVQSFNQAPIGLFVRKC